MSAEFEKKAAALGYKFRSPIAHPSTVNAPERKYSQETKDNLSIERDVPVPTRYGTHLFCDIFKPANSTDKLAPIICYTPYGKQQSMKFYSENVLHATGIKPEHISEHAGFEAADPAVFCPRGYAVINADIPGLWFGEGKATFVSPLEAEAFADLIEWAGTQSWSNGNVGLSGVSYLALTQFRVAELQPPHLKAMNIDEGWTDTYREVAYHGGIPDSWFWPHLHGSWGRAINDMEDLGKETEEHPFFDDFWKSKACDFSKIITPAYIVAGWPDQALHLRGTLEGFKNIKSKEKWLEVHGEKKWQFYYEPSQVEKQLSFFDTFLLNKQTDWRKTQPKVNLQVREKYFVSKWLATDTWPVQNTEYRKLYLDAKGGKLVGTKPSAEALVEYSGAASGPGTHRAEFRIVFDKPVELVGHMAAKLFMSAPMTTDMDVFVAVWKLDKEGNPVPFAYYAQYEDGPVALGWLRASHRELDTEKSTEYMPWLKHEREIPFKKGEVVELDIEIWPSGTRFEKGEGLRFDVQGTDVMKYPKPLVYTRHEDTKNWGDHRVHTGGKYGSYLLLPVTKEQ